MILALGWLGGMLSTLLIFICLLLIGLILLQKNRGAGLSGAFGGAGGYSAFGTKTGDIMTWITVSFVAVFLVLAITLNYLFEPSAPAGTPPIQAVSTTPINAPSPTTPGTQGSMQPIQVTQTPSSPQSNTPPTVKMEPISMPPAANNAPTATTNPSGGS